MKTVIVVLVVATLGVVLAPAAIADPDPPVVGDGNEPGTCVRHVPDQVPPVQVNPAACLPP
jgi:hypothetical protein